MSYSRYEKLAAVWEEARACGSLGSVSVEELREHAAGYASPNIGLRSDARCVDLGTGVGVPGLLLAMMHPETNWRLLDANQRRCEIADRAVCAVGLEDRVEVVHGRADDLAREPHWRSTHDLVVARLFGPPSEVAECGIPLVAERGSLVVSASADTAETWLSADLSMLVAAVTERWETDSGNYIRVQRLRGAVPDRFPRRPATRRREPLF
ncbi:MAG: class I SAM-dependent methyltransferase [Acidimicrobiaceae bacterium]|nr:class I SAM-dependent methyltransferase [Acidimicrobiaceae bacterium]